MFRASHAVQEIVDDLLISYQGDPNEAMVILDYADDYHALLKEIVNSAQRVRLLDRSLQYNPDPNRVIELLQQEQAKVCINVHHAISLRGFMHEARTPNEQHIYCAMHKVGALYLTDIMQFSRLFHKRLSTTLSIV
ncbi:hypothetical protein A6E01_20425 (plasmid) [Vibrio breoganii]|uniref:Uncharacterized protein n=1 Tax=Vibrio breoganii TaxID=553239 RepID=A0AAN0XZU9_9VIBR|nr:hypothetical protein [Vibrio breoganii]ANO35581.1 hypothetical protein A6E01_20425 [Vibrio breoganii]PML15841.1 hypothetical protein BCT84_07510 [Vibrio breoganii]